MKMATALITLQHTLRANCISLTSFGNQYRYNQEMFAGMFYLIKLNGVDSVKM